MLHLQKEDLRLSKPLLRATIRVRLRLTVKCSQTQSEAPTQYHSSSQQLMGSLAVLGLPLWRMETPWVGYNSRYKSSWHSFLRVVLSSRGKHLEAL